MSSSTGLIPGIVTVLFGLASVLDSALGNQLTIPAAWLALDVVAGVAGLVCQTLGVGRRIVFLLPVVSSSATGSALALMSGVARAGHLRRAQLLSFVFCFLSWIRWQLPWTPPAPYHDHWSGIVLTAVTTQCFIAWGGFFGSQARLVQSLRDQNEALASSRESDVRYELAQQRLDLSREMHDVLAHRLSLITMHASALEHRTAMENPERQRLGGVIQSNARASLTELRALLSELREEQPQENHPDIENLPQLAIENADPRHPVEISVDMGGATLPAGTGRHLYRIAQEAVTNARKHGAPGCIRVTLQCIADQCILEITNPIQAGASAPPGLGVRGMVERVHLCGGQLARSLDGESHLLRISVPVEKNQ